MEKRKGGASGVDGRQILEEQSILEGGDHVKFAAANSDPGKEVSKWDGARRPLAGSFGPIGGRRVCERTVRHST